MLYFEWGLPLTHTMQPYAELVGTSEVVPPISSRRKPSVIRCVEPRGIGDTLETRTKPTSFLASS